MTKLLLEHGADLNKAQPDQPGLDGITPLHATVIGRQPAVINWMLDQGVDSAPLSPEDWMVGAMETPLMVAIRYGMADVAILLIERGADVNRRSSGGHLPLHTVVDSKQDPRILEALLAHGDDATVKVNEKTAAELANDSKSDHRSRYLQLLGAAPGDE